MAQPRAARGPAGVLRSVLRDTLASAEMDVAQLFQAYDPDGNGRIDRDEFEDLVASVKEQAPGATGDLCANELWAAVCKCRLHVNETLVSGIWYLISWAHIMMHAERAAVKKQGNIR